MTKEHAVLILVRAIGRSNLIGTDFSDAETMEVTKPNAGYRVSLTISHEAFGKIHDAKVNQALRVLIGEDTESDS